ncbi:hypothetical protein SAMN05444156_2126 [Verrucomicrobium sp. GAS474]|uniref:hypothetical protein n=1 Tax=Verrucomicrobium sp. GAS474 TaxID=1882831 RepID=UPI00087DD51D|nr:hypothetical protein [Verrucomicrobium sp. GAS474]SDU12875.1 hypothetical protein SAMN05444156_2126 [Verrucomicrobium sp. GAS474]
MSLPRLPFQDSPSHPVERMLKRRHRTGRWLPALAALSLGLGGTLAAVWVAHGHSNPGRVDAVWGEGLALTLVAVVAGIAYGRRRHQPARTAAALDEALHAKNRLEAASQLTGRDHALAEAQREETAAFLQKESPRALRPGLDWVVGLAGTAAALLLFHAATFTVWELRAPHAKEPQASPANAPQAEIAWRSPSAETKASPIDEVSLRAAATSTTGLDTLRLEVEVNGEPRKTIPLAPSAIKEGKVDLSLPLDLDELELQPYDMVSYYLAGMRVTPKPSVPPLAATVSPVQFIQIRPFHDDARVGQGGAGTSYNLVVELKSAQLRVLKENFTLAHADIARENPAWRDENSRVGAEQDALARKTAEVVEKFTQDGLPAQIVYLLQQAHDFMPPASKQILAVKNTEALSGQGKALAAITEVEKYFTKVIAQGGKGSDKTKAADPFKDAQKMELPKRQDTPAGMLEKLAKEQGRLADELSGKAPQPTPSAGSASTSASSGTAAASSPTTANAPAPALPPPAIKPGIEAETFTGTPSERQTLVSQGISSLLNGKKLPDPVTAHLDRARLQALASLKQLDAGDNARAREPASATAAALQAALDEMNKEGQEQAKKDLADAQSLLNDAAQKAAQAGDPAKADSAQAAAEKVSEAHQRLQEEASKQQETGSAKQAQKLNDLADSVAASQAKRDLQELKALGEQAKAATLSGDVQAIPALQAKAAQVSARLQNLAAEAARKAQDGAPQGAELAQLAAGLEQSRATLARLAAASASTTGKSPAPGASPGKDGAGKGTDPGKGQGTQPGPGQQGEGQGEQGKGQGQQGQGQGQGDGASPAEDGQKKETPPGSGSGPNSSGDGKGSGGGLNPGGRGLAAMSAAQRDEIARTVQAELRSQLQQAEALLQPHQESAAPVTPAGKTPPPTSPTGTTASGTAAMQTLKKTLSDNYAPVLVPYEKIAPPLDDLIRWIHSEMAKATRQELLSTDDPARAPAAYRDAVADYFERLSKDYDRASAPPPTPAAKPAAP